MFVSLPVMLYLCLYVCILACNVMSVVPAGSPSRGGDVKVYVLDINQPSLPTLFTLFLCLLLSCGPFTCISIHKFSHQLSVFSLCSPSLISASLVLSTIPRSGELRTQKLKSHLVRAQSFNVLPLKPGVGQYIAIHATLTARDFFLAYFYTSGPFTCIFSKTSTGFSMCWLWLTHGSCVGPQNKIGHPAGCRFPYWVPAEYK